MTIPNQPLLSAPEAKQQLQDIVEKFFFWTLQGEDGQVATRLLVRSPPGLGKTKEALDWATQYQTDGERRPRRFGLRIMEALLKRNVTVFVPRHALAAEVKEVIEENLRKLGRSVEVPILRGLDHHAANGNAPCQRWLEARTLGEKGALR